jgi:hypothetical protein
VSSNQNAFAKAQIVLPDARKGMIGLNSPDGPSYQDATRNGKYQLSDTAVTDANQNANVLTSKCKTDRRSFQWRQEGKSFAFFYGSCATILSQRSAHQSNRPFLFFESRGHSLPIAKKRNSKRI